MAQDIATTKSEILAALQHPEAEFGLYLENLYILHEEEERPAVNATEEEILQAISELVTEGELRVEEVEGKILCLREGALPPESLTV